MISNVYPSVFVLVRLLMIDGLLLKLGAELRLIHASVVSCAPVFWLASCGTSTDCPAPVKLKPCPTLPVVKAAPFCSVPEFDPLMSLAVSDAPLPSHQLIMPLGGGVHV